MTTTDPRQPCLRIDAVQLREPERTEEGYIRAEGVIAAPDVLEYRTKEGETVRELVPPETLRDPEFLQSLEDKPLTLEHPPEPVTPENVSKYEVGDVGDIEWREELQRPDGSTGPGVKGKVVIRDAEAIEAYENGTLELSPAYEVELERDAGDHPKAKYDRVQAKRRAGNHVALTEQGRAGATARLRADSDAVVLRGDEDDYRDSHPLGVCLQRALEARTEDDRTQEDVLEEVARNVAGEASTSGLRSALNGETMRPSDEVLEAFALVLELDSQKLKRLRPAQGDTMPRRYDADLSVGDYARWNTSGRDARGKIESIERNGTIDVPGADVTVEGTDDAPAALLTVYQPADDGDAWQRTETKVAHKLSTLNKIEPLDVQPRTDTREDAMAEKVRLDSEMSVKVPEDQAEKIRRWKEDQEEKQVELSDQVESARQEIEAFKEEIEELKTERDELQEQIETKKKQLRMLADRMGLSEMMGASPSNEAPDGSTPGEGNSGETSSPEMDGMGEEKMDSLVAERLHEMAQARMDALEAAEMMGIDVEEGESTDSVRKRVVDAFYHDVDANRMDSAHIEARFDVAVDELESRAEERDESYESANNRTDSDDSPTDAESEYHEQVYG